MEDEGVGDMFEWDEIVAFDEEAQYVCQYVGRAYMTKDQSSTSLEGIPGNYHQDKKLFLPETAEKLARRRTFDHAIDLVPGAIPPWAPIDPMWAPPSAKTLPCALLRPVRLVRRMFQALIT